MALDDWERALAKLPADACIVGVDEVGRGPLAGDVVAAAAVLNTEDHIEGLADSKKLSAKRREVLSEQLYLRAHGVALGRAIPQEIDDLNILQASLLAMWRAVDALGVTPDLVLVDGRQLPAWNYPSIAVIKGDSRVPQIAAASIVAKVARDRYMCEQHELWPMYGFAAHKGYPTAVHLAALQEHGVCPVHRRSFAPVRAVMKGV
ncbi:ribonuclease HII [Congregibacter variabilis]|uniref:Ribonuclease HII n=1 Tax=Congregibacter variabilis TaxID=3081200 RepID=A0ABZ0I439_9GAMM|nr:ribonuclease HII [Congregibacter sp. IMCC43200]